MTKNISWAKRLCRTGMVTGVLVTALSGPVFAQPPGHTYDRDQRHEYRDEDRTRDQHRERRDDGRKREQRAERRDRDVARDRRDERQDRVVRRDRGVVRSRDYRRDQPYFSQPRYRQPASNARSWSRRFSPDYSFRDRFKDHRRPQVIVRHGKRHVVQPDRVRWYRDVVVVRPFGHWYPGYAHYHRDDDAYKWLAFTAITLGLLDYLNEVQQRELEAAQIAATTAPVGERIYWREGGASGYVVATREGTSESGRYCREFQQEVTIGGRAEEAYGTACLNPDGSWEVVSAEGY